jgi:hypothetical protein
MRNFKENIKISFKHFKTICKHKSWVSYYCNIAGLSKWQAFIHDLSKFSYIEFSESVKYYTGDRSPIDNCKDIKGYSLAWQHHKGRNPHHYEYWMDNFDKGTTPIRMPYKYVVEMLCDSLAAGQTYSENTNKSFTYTGELEYFINKFNNGCAMHPSDQKFIYLVLRNLKNVDNIPNCNKKNMKYILQDKFLNKRILKDLYEFSSTLSDEDYQVIRNAVEKELSRKRKENKKNAVRKSTSNTKRHRNMGIEQQHRKSG